MTEYQKAKAWRERRGLTMEALADLTGYSMSSISWFEKGLSPTRPNATRKDRKIDPYVWHRYKMCCAGVDLQLRKKQPFQW